ncbi:GntR family transcriptional regulator [Mycobacteroides abscessus]|uniref:GntR family transcriptional regulator n=2 Tax=Mycobacteroides abscessus TaxID=36809 RepID=A0ABD7HFV3_9MYCO|nr:GntR family transcriptional regulator [Mycobacteroides abscessus]RIR60960.1 GntR family transcriptional regulator [Mycobacteroides abscessus]RIR98004.1 GntR family transcriptional regulator [Mycobacteroides abscessus]RIS71450.1 GntR family transcriptional regulator [Mycobacteroides abscessus]RIS80324.1 GntR family transcriptional regulator [Mycobacteroides abscessus]RIT28082.1 GntR family transcriptional regulator [Mycobacteroides abscessus]
MARVTTLSLVDALANELRSRVYLGHLTPQDAITEAEVSRTFDVARPTAKAAIERLVGEGLLMRGAHKTARVPTLGPDDVRDIYKTRARLEAGVLPELARRGIVPARAIEANADIGRLSGSDPVSIVEPDMRFHAALVDAIGSSRTSRAFQTLASEVRLCMGQVQRKRLLTTQSIVADHQLILDAIAARDGERAVDVLTTHLARAREQLAAAVEGLAAGRVDQALGLR